MGNQRNNVPIDKDLLLGFARWVIYVLIGLNAIVWLGAVTVRCQNVEVHEQHADQEEFEDSIGVKRVTITSFDDRLVYWKKETRYTVKLGSFAYDSKSLTGFDSKQTGCRWMIYCKKHSYLYFMSPCEVKKE